MKTKRNILAIISCLLVAFWAVNFTACSCKKECAHEWGEWKTTQNATCTEQGTKERKCSNCGEVETTSIAALGHTWSEATCTAPKTCKTCAVTEGTATGHNFVCEIVKEETLKEAATSASQAVYYKSCECGEISTNEEDTFVVGEPLEHSFTLEIVKEEALKEAATCISQAVYYKSCECGEISTNEEDTFLAGNLLDHKDENHDHICDYGCGKDDIGEHSDSDTDNDHVCDYGCGAILEECKDSDADNDHKCDICGKENVSVHNYILVSSDEATCEKAKINHYKCNCGDTYDETEGDALGHNIVNVTPTEKQINGCEYELVYICTECNNEVSGEKIYHHNYIASITKPATCQEEGIKTLTCSCGDTKSETIAKDETGHNWIKGEVSNNTRIDECSHCHNTKTVTIYNGTTTDEIKASDLTNKEIEINDTNISLDNGVIDTIGNQNITVSADKLEDDNRNDLGLSDEQLSQVGDNPIYNFTINNGSENIANFGENNYVTITLPYELTEGEDVDSIAIWFINDEGKLEAIKATYNNGYVTFKTNHFSYYTVTRLTPAERCALYGHGYICYHIDGSCTKDEYDLYVCARCYDKYIDKTPGKYKEAQGHVYESEVHEATCTETGYTIYSCVNCNHSYQVRHNVTGHNYEIIESIKATCQNAGYIKYKCANCDDEYTITLSKTSHIYTDTIVNPTCTETGYILHKCNNCEYSYKDGTIAALGHNYIANSWEWNDDYSKATLILICENNSEHKVTLNATVEKITVSGTCSNYTRTTYKASCSYEGTTYTDEKVIEEGNASHNFSSDWSMNKDEHWHECSCGAKTDVSAHTFENAIITKNPTCVKVGERTSYCVCGATKTEEIPATGNHNYVNGVCTECGDEYAGEYYINLAKSWKTINGFAIKVQDFTLEVKEKNNQGIFELIGNIKQIDIAELYIYFENDEIEGAATGSATIYNGPLSNADATCYFKALIQDGNVYIDINYGNEKTTRNNSYKMTLEALLNELDIEITEDLISANKLYYEILFSSIDTLVDKNSEKVNEILQNLFNILFTFTEQTDGTYIASLDITKLKALQDNLLQKPIAEVIDVYFGEGAFNAIVKEIKKIIELKIPEITNYIDEIGLDSKELIKKINEYAKKMGAENNFDLNDILNNEAFSEMTIGMLMFETEDDSYIEYFDELVGYLRSNTLYELMPSDEVEDIQNVVETTIDLISKHITLSFKTNHIGEFSSLDVNANKFDYTESDTNVTLDFKLNLTTNEKIEVTWSNIISEIENRIVLPNEEMLDENIDAYWYSRSGYVTYKGEEYYYRNGIEVDVEENLYNELLGVSITPDCNGWNMYDAIFTGKKYCFVVITIEVDDNAVTLILDEINNTVVEIVETETGYKAIYEDGTEKEFSKELFEKDYDETAYMLADIYFAVFDESMRGYILSTDSKYYYYNPSTKEYAEESPHEFEYEYILEGDTCEDGVIVRTTCKHCDYYDEYTRKWCYIEYKEIDLSEYSSCGGTLEVSQCEICGKASYISDSNFNCNFDEIVETEILDEDGCVIGHTYTKVCQNCGLKVVNKKWTEKKELCISIEYAEISIYCGETVIVFYENSNEKVNHTYEYTIEFEGETCEDGIYVTRYCTTCGDSDRYHKSGHMYESEDINLEDLGLCGGYAYKYYCLACNEIISSYINDYVCNWEYAGENEEGYEIYICTRCNTMKLTYTFASEKDENCEYAVTTVSIYYANGEEVYRCEENYTTSTHNYETRYELMGTSCEDGVMSYSKCKDCGYESEYEYSYHKKHEKEKIDLSELGSTCGGYATLYSCACGEKQELEIDDCNCDLGYKNCDLWIENALTGYQESTEDTTWFNSNAYIYACAVTDPAERACSFKIRYAYYWLKDPNTCMAYKYETWQLGYNEETNTYLYEITYKTGSKAQYHNYVDNSTYNHWKYECSDCGSYHYENYYYDNQNNLIKYEEFIQNTLNNGDDKYKETIREYSGANYDLTREYYKTISSDGTENWSEELIKYEAYEGPFGYNGVKKTISYTSSNEYGTDYEKEVAYVMYRGYQYSIYDYYRDEDGWHRNEYSYSFENECLKTTKYTNNKGEVEITQGSACKEYYTHIKDSTCSQEGIYCYECPVCGNKTNYQTYEPNDHDWEYDGEKYYCRVCGLENANGISGSIIMEDLTEDYGNNQYYVVGYYARNDIKFSNYISLILSDDTEVAIWSGIDFVTIDGITAYAFSKEAVKTWAEENGYTNYDVRFTFVPTTSEGDFDYAITF